MTINIDILKQTYPESLIGTSHGILIQEGRTLKVIQKKDLKPKDIKINLNFILQSLAEQINDLSIEDRKYSIKLSNHFITRLNKTKHKFIQIIIDIFTKIINFCYGHGFKTTLELAQEVKQKTAASLTGFIPENFDASLSKIQTHPTDARFQTDEDFKIIRKNFEAFCTRVDKKGPVVNVPFETPQNSAIPPTIHFVWLGSKVPEKVTQVIDTWRPFHQGWNIKIWTEDQIDSFPWQPAQREAFNEALNVKCWAEAVDIWRYNILYEEGGIYSDTDVVCLRSFQDLISNEITFFAGQETNQVTDYLGHNKPLCTCNALMGASKANPVMKYCIDSLIPRSKSKHPENPKIDILTRTGPFLLSRACHDALQGSQSEKTLILPCSYIYPLPFNQSKKQMSLDEIRQKYIAPESLCVHLWDASWV